MRSIAGMLACDTHPLVTPRVKKYLVGTGGFDDSAWRAWQLRWFRTGLAAVEKRLAGQAQTGVFCHGDQPTMADICLASVVAVMRILQDQRRRHADHRPHHRRVRCASGFENAAPGRQQGAPSR